MLMIKFTWSCPMDHDILAHPFFLSSALMTGAKADKCMYFYGCKASKIMVITDEGDE